MNTEKRYVVRKYIMAKSLKSAIRKEPKTPTDEIWIDQEWIKVQDEQGIKIGFEETKKKGR